MICALGSNPISYPAWSMIILSPENIKKCIFSIRIDSFYVN